MGKVERFRLCGSEVRGLSGWPVNFDLDRARVSSACLHSFEAQTPGGEIGVEGIDLCGVRKLKGAEFLPLVGRDSERQDLGRTPHRPRPETDALDMSRRGQLDLDPLRIPISVPS